MCGIAGILGHRSPASSLKMMLATQAHRGPDHTAVFIENQIALGHNRLAIIDCSPEANQHHQRRRFDDSRSNDVRPSSAIRPARLPSFYASSDTIIIVSFLRSDLTGTATPTKNMIARILSIICCPLIRSSQTTLGKHTGFDRVPEVDGPSTQPPEQSVHLQNRYRIDRTPSTPVFRHRRDELSPNQTFHRSKPDATRCGWLELMPQVHRWNHLEPKNVEERHIVHPESQPYPETV